MHDLEIEVASNAVQVKFVVFTQDIWPLILVSQKSNALMRDIVLMAAQLFVITL